MGWFLDECRHVPARRGLNVEALFCGRQFPLGALGGGRLQGYAIRLSLAKQAAQQRYEGGADEGDTAAGHELIDPQIGGSHSSITGGGVSETI